ncbi:MAG TPA: hypothetical protein VFU72_11935 [Nitrolancea sp.]|jgi:hypothetical protein|nr:hypothetical protein [Nitrolancea sp.]
MNQLRGVGHRWERGAEMTVARLAPLMPIFGRRGAGILFSGAAACGVYCIVYGRRWSLPCYCGAASTAAGMVSTGLHQRSTGGVRSLVGGDQGV